MVPNRRIPKIKDNDIRFFRMAALAVCFAVPAFGAGGCLPRNAILKKLDETDH